MGRRIKVYDSRKGTTTTDYYGNGDGQKGKVYTVKDHENRTTTYTYISTTGQVFSVQNPLGKLQYYAYNDRGQMEMTWGDTTYPVKNDYDAMGRRVEMHTYQSGTSWNTASWPSPEPTHYQTTWEFDAASGQLKKKADANGQFVEYTYTPDGRQKTRTWARKINNTDNLITTYAYNDVTGEMTGITYSDGTPSVTYEYNRLGRQSKVIQTKAAPNGWTHTTTFNLNQYLELESEAITGDIYAKTITRNHQGSGTGLLPGRDAGLSIGNEYSVEYDYDEYGRLNYISGDSLGLPGGAVIYEYVPNSDLVNAVNYLDAGANDLAWTIRAYGTLTDHRDLLTSVENHNGSTVMSKYAYQYDNAGRRTAVLTTGEAFINNAYNIWGYNDRSELQASNRYNGNQIVIPPDPQTEVTGERRLYHYDPIGNRVDYTFGTGSPLYYCSENGLNQYDSTGVQQSCPQGNPSESFSYDHDGNMTADGALTYEWDGENRLTAVYPTNPASTSKKCTFTYDFMSRRIRKQVYTRNDNNTAWRSDPSEDWRFVYDQWNVVLVLDGRDGPDEGTTPDNVTVRKYTWGLDLSGLTGSVSSAGIHGAGGIGGLLAAVETGGEGDYVYWYLYDGNGNVGQVLDATDTENITTAALYEYDPYGNLIVADGYYALNNPFRFSTKWFDDETGLGYWGHRYYLPPLGRWISRDPIGEEGGLNLQGYVGNMPTKRVDLLGKYIIAVGGAGSIGDGDLMGTVMLLWGAESDWYNSCECNVVPFEGSVLISAPTGALWLIAPDWEGAVQKLTSNVKSYMDYYRQIMKRRDNGECVIPEQLHILGFSDGASTIALWLNRGAPSGARDFPNPIGLISLIDLVRTPYGELVPNGDRPDKAYEVNRAVGSRHVAFRNIDTVLNWAGYRIAQWNNNVIEPPVSHSQAAGSGTVRAALRREIDQITPEYMKDFGCECSGR